MSGGVTPIDGEYVSSLFDNHGTWRTSPMEAFQAFVIAPEFLRLGRRAPASDASGTPRPIRERSAMGYIAMFGKFIRWIDQRQLTIFDVTKLHIRAFMDDKSAGSRHGINSFIRVRYLRMLERVYDHLKTQPNPARSAYFEAKEEKATGHESASAFLTPAEQRAFMEALPEYFAPAPKELQAAWIARRDRAMQAVMLGAGLKVSEAIGLYVENIGSVEDDGYLVITISPASTDGLSPWHETRLRPFAVPEVLRWLDERKAMMIDSLLLFPCAKKFKMSRKKGSKLVRAEMNLDTATVYRRVRETFARANVHIGRRGGRTLRNSFAVTELQDGTEPEVVQGYLGLLEEKSMNRYLICAKVSSRQITIN